MGLSVWTGSNAIRAKALARCMFFARSPYGQLATTILRALASGSSCLGLYEGRARLAPQGKLGHAVCRGQHPFSAQILAFERKSSPLSEGGGPVEDHRGRAAERPQVSEEEEPSWYFEALLWQGKRRAGHAHAVCAYVHVHVHVHAHARAFIYWCFALPKFNIIKIRTRTFWRAMKFIKQKITLNIIWKKYYPGEFILCCFSIPGKFF